jgi:hypothetical protein
MQRDDVEPSIDAGQFNAPVQWQTTSGNAGQSDDLELEASGIEHLLIAAR